MPQYIPLNKENMPGEFNFDVGEQTFQYKMAYNEIYDYFTISIYVYDDTANAIPVIEGEILLLNKPIFSDFDDERLPLTEIIPLDLSGQAERITWENFGVTVFLYVDDDLEEPDGTGDVTI